MAPFGRIDWEGRCRPLPCPSQVRHGLAPKCRPRPPGGIGEVLTASLQWPQRPPMATGSPSRAGSCSPDRRRRSAPPHGCRRGAQSAVRADGRGDFVRVLRSSPWSTRSSSPRLETRQAVVFRTQGCSVALCRTVQDSAGRKLPRNLPRKADASGSAGFPPWKAWANGRFIWPQPSGPKGPRPA